MTDGDAYMSALDAKAASALIERVIKERDEAREALDVALARERAERDARDVARIERNEARAEVARCREALERIAAWHHAPGKTYKAAWVESVRIAREALGGGDD